VLTAMIWFTDVSRRRHSFHSIPQADAEKQVHAIESLQEYVSRSTNFWILVPNAIHKTSGLLACEESWRRRGWCRFERWCCELRVGGLFRRPLIVNGPHSVSVSNFSDVMILETRSGPMNGEFSMDDDRSYLARLVPGMFDAKLRDLLLNGDLLHYRWLMFVRPYMLMWEGLSSEAMVPAHSEQRPALASKRIKRHSGLAAMRQMLSMFRRTLSRPKLKPDPLRLSWAETDLPVQPPDRHPEHCCTVDGCGNGDKDLPSFLARYGFSSLSDVSHPTPFFPLFCAAAEGNLAITRALLSAGVDPNMRCAFGMNTALHGSCAISGATTTALLLDAKATPDCPSPNGITPMHRAAAVGDVETVKLILAAGADALAQRKDTGASPLHSAAGGGHKDVYEVLLQHEPRAAPLTDHAGRTADQVLASRSDVTMAVDQLPALAAPLLANKSSGMNTLSDDQLERHQENRSAAVKKAVQHHDNRRRNSIQPKATSSHDLEDIGLRVDADASGLRKGSNDDVEA
jgi:ankyrin repeat protein